MNSAVAVFFVFFGCCSNVVFLELMVSEVPECGNLVTFSQFLLIAAEGFIFTSKFGTKKSVIPMKYYASMVAMFFVVQVVNNMVFIFSIPMPLHMIFRSGSLAATMVLGIFILKRRYKTSKYLSVILISLGIVVCTIASANQVDSNSNDTGNVAYGYMMWSIGILLLVFALFMSSRMGIFQEQTYAKFGKHPKEALFFNHALPLPAFILMANNIYSTALTFNKSAPYILPVVGFGVPNQWILLFLNCITQYICIRSVFFLTTECTSLTVTLVVTLRKFVSLLFSIYYFQNPFTMYHWIGALCVFIGTLIFTEIISVDKYLNKPKKLS